MMYNQIETHSSFPLISGLQTFFVRFIEESHYTKKFICRRKTRNMPLPQGAGEIKVKYLMEESKKGEELLCLNMVSTIDLSSLHEESA